jgi:hypothetical protein
MTTKTAYKEFLREIRKTEVIDFVTKSLEQEPVRLFGIICRTYEKTGQPVPDHQIHPSGYVGEVAMKALVSAGLIRSLPGQRQALFLYEPTEQGLRIFKQMSSEGVYSS